MNDADLACANLSHANLSPVDLRDADLHFANLSYTDLSGANLSHTNLSNATMNATILAQMDLRTTKGLPEIQHDGPSILQLHTIQLSLDESALHFLRRSGILEVYIAVWHAEWLRDRKQE